jgi:hypothetical protein
MLTCYWRLGLKLKKGIKMRGLIIVLVVLFLSGLTINAGATGIIKVNWLDEYSSRGACGELLGAANDCTLCHMSGGGSNDLNPYAEDMQTYKYDQDVAWIFAIPGIAPDDSDGDGVISQVEIVTDCTLPGDPTSVPVEEFSWSKIQALYR